MQKIVQEIIQEQYTPLGHRGKIMIGPQISVTPFGSCYKAHKIRKRRSAFKFMKSSFERVYVLKVDKKEYKSQPALYGPLFNAIEIVNTMKHPNLQSHYEVVDSKTDIFVVTDTFKLNSLSSCIERRSEPLSEGEALVYLKQLAEAGKQLQNHQIIHKNISTDSLYMDDKDNLRLGGFFFAERNVKLSAIVDGPPSYMAYEMLISDCTRPYVFDSKVDLWSIGVVYYKLLTGSFPFSGITKLALIESIQKNPDREFEYFRPVSQESKDLIRRLLDPDPQSRISWEAFFNHDVFKKVINWDSGDVKSCDLVSGNFFLEDIRDKEELLRRIDNIKFDFECTEIGKPSSKI